MKLVILFLVIGLVKTQDSNDLQDSRPLNDNSRSSDEATDQNRLATTRRNNARGQWTNRRNNVVWAGNNRQTQNLGQTGFRSQTGPRTIIRPGSSIRNTAMKENTPRNSRQFVDSTLRKRQSSRTSPFNARSRFGSRRRVTTGGSLFRRIVVRQTSPPYRLVYRYVPVQSNPNRAVH